MVVLCFTTPSAAVRGYLLIHMWAVFRVFRLSGCVCFAITLRSKVLSPPWESLEPESIVLKIEAVRSSETSEQSNYTTRRKTQKTAIWTTVAVKNWEHVRCQVPQSFCSENEGGSFFRNVGTKQLHYTAKDPKDCHLNNSRGEKLRTCTLSGASKLL